MGSITKIQWCDHTFNPWRGCSKVHTGCLNCYAEKQSKRNPGVLGIWGDHGTRVVASKQTWNEPLKWNAAAKAEGVRKRVFCASLADVFEDWQGPVQTSGNVWLAPNFRAAHGPNNRATLRDVRRRLFELIDETPWLDWLLLTKRPENVRRMYVPHLLEKVRGHVSQNEGDGYIIRARPNVWLGTSISDQQTADKAIPELLKCRDLAPVLFVSVEPLVGPVSLRPYMMPVPNCPDVSRDDGCCMHPASTTPECHRACDCPHGVHLGIDWVILGGESGPKARPCDVEWIRDAVEECQRSAIPVFVKQLGAVPIDTTFRSPSSPAILTGVKDHKGGDPQEWPLELRVREFPEVKS